MKTIELIDKYEVHQSKEGDYNPPSYIWRDNTGELIRCKDCKHYDVGENDSECWTWCKQLEMSVDDDFFCKDGKRKEE